MRGITSVILLVGMISLGIYDFFAYINGGTCSTVSKVIHDSGISSPAILLVIGYILGHIFSPLEKIEKK